MQNTLALDIATGRPNPSATQRWDGGSRVVEVVCDGCGVSYIDYKRRVQKAKRHYCNAACYRANRSGNKNPKWRGGLRTATCETCGKEFQRTPGAWNTRKSAYCSFECGRQGIRIYPDAATAKREHSRRRETRKRAAKAIRTHTYKEWIVLVARYKRRCAMCGQKKRLTRDHIIPISRGGGDGIENIQPLCHSCNAKKHDDLWLIC